MIARIGFQQLEYFWSIYRIIRILIELLEQFQEGIVVLLFVHFYKC